jgi:hypothetical protein
LTLLLFLLLFKWDDSQSDAAASRRVLTTHAMQLEKPNTKPLRKPKKKIKICIHLGKKDVQNHVQQKFREKKNTKNNKTTKEDCGSHQDWSSFELLTLKLTKSPQNGC